MGIKRPQKGTGSREMGGEFGFRLIKCRPVSHSSEEVYLLLLLDWLTLKYTTIML